MCWSTGGVTYTGGTTGWGCTCAFPNCPHANTIVDYNFSGYYGIQDFSWALQQMKNGNKVCRRVWGRNIFAHQITSSETSPKQYIVWESSGDSGGHYTPTQQDMRAADWEFYVKKCGECGRPKS